jgi:hypothetical protein
MKWLGLGLLFLANWEGKIVHFAVIVSDTQRSERFGRMFALAIDKNKPGD